MGVALEAVSEGSTTAEKHLPLSSLTRAAQSGSGPLELLMALSIAMPVPLASSSRGSGSDARGAP